MSAPENDNASRPTPGGESGTALPILLAEDNTEDVLIWTRALKTAGLENGPHVVRDGVEAIDYLAGNGIYADRALYPFPGLLLLDLTMPRRNGFEVLEWWGSEPRPQPLTIVVLTGTGMRGDIDRAYRLGAAFFLMKPSLLAEVTELARRALGFYRQAPPRPLPKSAGEPPPT